MGVFQNLDICANANCIRACSGEEEYTGLVMWPHIPATCLASKKFKNSHWPQTHTILTSNYFLCVFLPLPTSHSIFPTPIRLPFVLSGLSAPESDIRSEEALLKSIDTSQTKGTTKKIFLSCEKTTSVEKPPRGNKIKFHTQYRYKTVCTLKTIKIDF